MNSESMPSALATRRRRLGAFVIDSLLLTVGIFIVGWLLSRFFMLPPWLGFALNGILFVLYFDVGDAGSRGTPGKRVMEIRVVDEAFGTPAMGRLLARAVLVSATLTLSQHSVAPFLVVELFASLFAANLFFCFFHPQGRTAIDILTKTVVVREPTPSPGSIALVSWSKKTIMASALGFIAIWAASIYELNTPEQTVALKLSADTGYRVLGVADVVAPDGDATSAGMKLRVAAVEIPNELATIPREGIQANQERFQAAALPVFRAMYAEDQGASEGYVVKFRGTQLFGIMPTHFEVTFRMSKKEVEDAS